MTEGLVRRQRLLDLLSGSPKLRVVAAPSGFGKTTLLRSWADALPSDARLVWVALSAEVATRQDFWLLVAASAARRGDLGATAHKELVSKLESLDDPVPGIVEFLQGREPVLLALDAYEHLRDLTTTIDDDLIRLVSAVDGLEVVVTTRAATRLTDDVLVMRGLVQPIGEAELRFTTDEVAQLLELHAPHAVDAAERIVRETHGYPLGVRAVSYALARLGSMPAFDSNSWQRLVTEALKSQIADPALIDFLLDTCAPPYFDGDLACQLTGAAAADVDHALAELAWNGFGRWIPYARECPVFQYVESVRDVVLSQLRASQPERYERGAGLAAAWLHRHADHDRALALAIDARQYGLASSICCSLVLSNPDIYTTTVFERHLRRVPRRLLPRYPVLAFILGMVDNTRPATRAAAAENFRIAAAHALDGIDELTPRDAFYHHVGREVCLRYLGLSQEAGAASKAALAFLDSMPAADRDELGDFLPMARSVLAFSLFLVGDVDRASTLVDQAAATATDPWWRDYALAFAAAIHAFNGRSSDTRAALATIDPNTWPSHRKRPLPHALGSLGQAALHLDELDFEATLAELDVISPPIANTANWPILTWTMAHARLGMGEAGGEARRIEEALTSRPPKLGLGLNLTTAALFNVLAILWLADGNAAKARRALRTDTPYRGQLAPASLLYQLVTGDPEVAVRGITGLLEEPGHTVRSTVAVDTLGAAAALRVGSDRTALELLGRAAALSQRTGARAHLMYVPDADLAALRDLASATGATASAAYLAGELVTPIAAIETVPVMLTPREVEVLSTWAKYRTRVEVANALFVSANTVKSQLHSAYRKLGVTTKDAAIQRAIELRPPPPQRPLTLHAARLLRRHLRSPADKSPSRPAKPRKPVSHQG
ncbi:MAG: LuxR C-terminal-related transcriptional regulator [Ilumatobacteraceae bacterium]